MKKIIGSILVLIVGTNCFRASAQVGSIKQDSLSFEMKQIAMPESEPNWIKFKSSAKIKPETLFEEHKIAFGLSPFDKMQVSKSFIDDIGFTHHNYQQFYKSIPIDGESINVHTNKKGETYAATGRILKGINVEISPKLTAQEAIDLALKFVNAKEYRWQNTFWENELKQKNSKADTTYYPQALLVIKEERNFNSGLGIFHLAYRMDIHASSPLYSQRIFIDAQTGEIIGKYPLQSN
jgi:Zn-dependent metalloprotease